MVSGWSSEGPVPEVLDDTAAAPALPRWGAAVLALAAVAVAFALGLQSRGVSVAGVSLGVEPPRLAAGTLRSVASSGGAAAFALPVHNSAPDAVDVAVAAVPGAVLRRTPSTRVPAGAWAEVPVSLRADCTAGGAPPEAVTLAVGGGASPGRVEVGLAEEARAVADLRSASCESGRAFTPARLAGVWLVEQVFGRWTGLTGRHVVSFGRDGSMVADPEGVRFTSHRGVLGRYVLRGDRLVSVAQGFVGYACLPGARAAWRAEQLPDGRAVLTFLGGRNCPDQPGEQWVLRRLARPDA